MIDTHAHLDALDDAAAALARARAAGVTRVVAIGSGVEAATVTRTLAAHEPGVYLAAGIHPHQAADGEDPRVVVGDDAVAIGEIGLDFFRDYAPREQQRRLFSEQLDLASELGKAVIIHTRDADEETAEVLERFDGPVVLHCFSSPGLLPVALERGYYVSFAGNVTYPKADELRAAAARVPLNRLLVETDSPYLAPQPVRGKRNEPAHVVHTVAALADLRGEDPAALAGQIDANASAVFALP
ncbi:MAG TPA: TatD family hydrolase [Gaiellaceae bacterium]|nr:TatD family hydrolase [Gaiellaceae bacterium]